MLTDCRPGHEEKGVFLASRFSSAKIARKNERRAYGSGYSPGWPVVEISHPHAGGVSFGKTDCPAIPMVRGGPGFYGCLDRKAQEVAFSEFKAPCLGVR